MPPKILESVSHLYESMEIILNKVDQRKDFINSFSAKDLEKLANEYKEITAPNN